MVERELTRRLPLTGLWARLGALPWWAQVLIVWAASRIVTTGILLWFAGRQEENAWTGASPGYLDFAQLWDGTWYHHIALAGYPAELPLDAEGRVSENAWAFLPVYPMLVRGLMVLTGLPWAPVSVGFSLLCSLGAVLVMHRLFAHVLPAGSALFAVAVVCFAPLSPILQVSYAESLHLLLLAWMLLWVVEQRYLALLPVVAVMALTRPSGLAVALFLGLHVVHRLLDRVREPFPAHRIVPAIVLAVFSAAMGLVWPVLAWWATGSPTAYLDTELAWRASYPGAAEALPFSGWVQAVGFWLPGPLGLVALAALVVGFGLLLFAPWVRRLGATLRWWLGSYAIYLLAVFFPQTSLFRLLMPLFPLAGALAVPRSRPFRAGLLALLIAGQVTWVWLCWWVDGYDWTPP